jgi:hypothetical protein
VKVKLKIKPIVFKLQHRSFDLSLSPKVVWALTPTVSGSLQRAGFTLSTAEGIKPTNTPSQFLDSSTKVVKAPNKLLFFHSRIPRTGCGATKVFVRGTTKTRHLQEKLQIQT